MDTWDDSRCRYVGNHWETLSQEILQSKISNPIEILERPKHT